MGGKETDRKNKERQGTSTRKAGRATGNYSGGAGVLLSNSHGYVSLAKDENELTARA